MLSKNFNSPHVVNWKKWGRDITVWPCLSAFKFVSRLCWSQYDKSLWLMTILSIILPCIHAYADGTATTSPWKLLRTSIWYTERFDMLDVWIYQLIYPYIKKYFLGLGAQCALMHESRLLVTRSINQRCDWFIKVSPANLERIIGGGKTHRIKITKPQNKGHMLTLFRQFWDWYHHERHITSWKSRDFCCRQSQWNISRKLLFAVGMPIEFLLDLFWEWCTVCKNITQNASPLWIPSCLLQYLMWRCLPFVNTLSETNSPARRNINPRDA